MTLNLCYYGDPILRKRAQEITVFDDELKKFSEALIKAVYDNPAAGLASPQVGKSIRMFVRRNFIVKDDGWIEYTDTTLFINPRITVLDDELQEEDEGCLSIPGLRGNVIRPMRIRVEASDIKGNPFTEELEGYKARIVLHENDHINGVLYIDRMDPKERKKLEPELRAIKKKYAS